jgi:hypothetical protein
MGGGRHVAPLRSSASLHRKQGRCPTRPLVLIVCEGETEMEYCEAMRRAHRLSAIEVEIPNEIAGSDPLRLVAYAEQRAREEGGYDHIFCVFDRDTHPQFNAARTKLRALASGRRPLPIREAISIPAFELWILLHFERVERPFANCEEVIRRIRDGGHIPDYVKADRALCERLIVRAVEAVDRARWLAERAREAGFANPFTNVHELVQVLQDLAERADE